METVLRNKISCYEGMTSGIWTLDPQTGIIQQFLSIPLTKEEKTTAKSILEAPATPAQVLIRPIITYGSNFVDTISSNGKKTSWRKEKICFEQ